MQNKNDSATRLIQMHITNAEAKHNFEKYVIEAEKGIQVVIGPEEDGFSSASLIRSDVLATLVDNIKIHIIETPDEELGKLTIAVDALPMQGQGNCREEAVQDLLDATIQYIELHIEEQDLYNKANTPMQNAVLFKLLRYNKNRNVIRAALGL